MLRAAATVFLAHGAGTIFSFLRNVIIGRMVSVEDFGVVSTFALAFAIIQTATYAGFDRLLVQDKDGDNEEFQANLQLLQVLRGLFGAVFFLILAWPYAWFLGNLDIYWAYLAMSVIPLIRGFIHFDIYRMERGMRFTPTALVTAGAPLVSLLSVLALSSVIDDYRIILIAIVIQQIVYVVLTHVLAKRKWRISWDTKVSLRALRFGIPLLINGILVFAIHNGDMLLVGGFFDMEVLGWFYVATLLTVTVSLHLETTVRSITLPGLSRNLENAEAFAKRAADAVEFAAFASIAILATTYLIGTSLVLLLFGVKYQAALAYMIPLAVMYGIKSLKAGPNTIAISRAQTHIPVYTNLPRGISLFISALALWQGAGLPVVIAIAIVAEIICVFIAYFLAMRPNGGLTPASVYRPLCLAAVVMIAVVLDTLAHPPSPILMENFRWTQLLVLFVILLSTAMLPNVRGYILARFSRK